MNGWCVELSASEGTNWLCVRVSVCCWLCWIAMCVAVVRLAVVFFFFSVESVVSWRLGDRYAYTKSYQWSSSSYRKPVLITQQRNVNGLRTRHTHTYLCLFASATASAYIRSKTERERESFALCRVWIRYFNLICLSECCLCRMSERFCAPINLYIENIGWYERNDTNCACIMANALLFLCRSTIQRNSPISTSSFASFHFAFAAQN